MHASKLVSILLVLFGAATVQADRPYPVDHSIHPVTIAVLGDTPYGGAQIADFPALIADINADADVTRVVHVGDIKNGSSRCDTSYFEWFADQVATFADPFVLTPGDNDWTDCHRSNNGKYDPIDRLETLREIFYSTPERTLGGMQRPLFTQAAMPGYEALPENQAWVQARTVFATLHVVGSRNGLAPWFTDNASDEYIDDPARRLAEVELRTQAAIDWIDRAFELARFPNTRGVVLFMQADTWPGDAADGFSAILSRIAEHTLAFGKPVLVVQGDSHVYRVDQPLLAGDLDHGIESAVPNLTRLVVEGATTGEWLKLRVDPKADELFSWERIIR